METLYRQRFQKGRKGIFSIIFSRKVIMILLVLLQVSALWALFAWLSQFVLYVYGAFLVIQLGLVIFIMNRRGSDAAFKMSWMALIMTLPVVGMLFYLFVESQTGSRRIQKRLRNNIAETKDYLTQNPSVIRKMNEEEPHSIGLALYMDRFGGYPAYTNTDLKYYPLGDDFFPDLLEKLEEAESFIFMEFFILDRGEMLEAVLDILRRKAKDGVDVRIMYDGTCSLSLLPFSYPERLRAYGISCRVFSQVIPMFSTYQNNRDHRKIVVIDGKTGFTGGVNLADEYINRKERFGHWKDSAVMLEGDAVKSLTVMFLQMWHDRTEQENYSKYIQPPVPAGDRQGGFVMPYGDSPLDDEPVGEYVYLDIINHAEKYLHIFSPYLVLPDVMMNALKFASKRGVDVKLIVPHIPDKKYTYLLARISYEELIPAGVRIFEYEPGFIHSKCFVSDDRCCTVGTVNMDFRSLYLHFECGVYASAHPMVADVEADFQETLRKCTEITEEDVNTYPFIKRMTGYILRVVAPQM